MIFPVGASCRPARLLLLSGAALLALAWTTRVQAQALVFSNFSSTGGLTLTSSSTATTTSDGTVLRLVTATTNDIGGAFSTTQRNVTGGFSTAFDFRLTNPGGSSDGTATGADGFVFVIQHIGVNALGASGEGIGFLNIGAASVGVEFDTFNNSGSPRFDPSSNHLGVDIGGSVTSVATANVSPDFDNGAKWTGWIDYNASASTLDVRVSNTGVRPTSANLSYTISPATLTQVPQLVAAGKKVSEERVDRS